MNNIINQVWQTNKYEMFRLSKFNRNILLNKEIMQQAEEGLISPIIVNEDMTIIDGQHRFMASKKLGKSVKYIIINGLGDADIVRMNTVQRKWNMMDFAVSFANNGSAEYQKLIDLTKKKVGNFTTIIQVSMNVNSLDKRVRELYENGRFEFHDYGKVVEFFDLFNDFSKRTGVRNRTNTGLALFKMFKLEKFDAERLIGKMIQQGDAEDFSVKTRSLTEATKDLLDVYNRMLSPKSPMYLDYYLNSQGHLIINEELSEWASAQVRNNEGERYHDEQSNGND